MFQCLPRIEYFGRLQYYNCQLHVPMMATLRNYLKLNKQIYGELDCIICYLIVYSIVVLYLIYRITL